MTVNVRQLSSYLEYTKKEVEFFDNILKRNKKVYEIEYEEMWAKIAETDICKKWWAHMKDVMPSNPDNSPVSKDLREVFHID